MRYLQTTSYSLNQPSNRQPQWDSCAEKQGEFACRRLLLPVQESVPRTVTPNTELEGAGSAPKHMSVVVLVFLVLIADVA